MTITHKLSIDLAKRECTPQIDAVQNDYGRSLSLLLHTNGIPWPIPTNITAVIRYCRNDGTGGEYDTLSDGSCAWSATGNTLTVSLASQVLTVAGDVALSILLTDGDQAISTFDISLYVHTSVSSRISRSDNYVNRSEEQAFSEDVLSAIGSRIISGDISSIVLLGDSITAGIDNSSYTNDSEVDPTHYCWANAFKKFIEERYGIRVRNLGIPGSLMDAQKTAALNILTKDDFVIWLTGTNDRNNPESFKANLLSCVNAVKDKCSGLLLISGIPATEADENNYPATMQKMDEIAMSTVFGHVPYFSMYQAFTTYCELHGFALADCYADHVHPNHLGHYIMFRILCHKLNIPLNPYVDYQRASSWWTHNYLDGITFQYGYINYLSGAVSPRNDTTFGIFEEDYIAIEPGKTYTVNAENAVVSSGEAIRAGIKYYAKDQSYTGRYVDDMIAFVPYTFTVPSDINTAYLRLNFVAGSDDSVSVDWSNAIYTLKENVE